MISPKDLKKLAKLCRESGIKHYKCPDFEFTLTDDLPEPKMSKVAIAKGYANMPTAIPNEDALTDEQLLFYSVGTPEAVIGQDGDK